MRVVLCKNIPKLSASAAVSGFCEWVQVVIGVYIPHSKYQIKPQSCLWFSAACTAAIVCRNHFFYLYQQDKSEFKVNLDRLVIVAKEFLKLPNLHMLI